uniref:Late embryogenesis abundant protein LEA-2 subgroup domain-containing protein n=2 Tax=Leersia perrieri TaxID=77586 RepID=A0A0D9WBH7_9ORYZ
MEEEDRARGRGEISLPDQEEERKKNSVDKMHAKTDSEVTSLAPSSPPRSPTSRGGGRHPVYYVQSPSRDSHDGEKTATSVHSTPALSPMGSPRHSVGRDSSSSRFSGHPKRKGDGAKSSGGRKGAPPGKGWQEIGVIEEEGLLDDDDERRGIPKRCKYFLIFVLGFVVLFSFFALVLWGASRSQKPQIAMKSITFENFIIQAGTDASLVPTDMATTNSTVKFTYRNTGTFFGIHVTADAFQLSYSQLTLASGDLKKFYQARSSRRTVSVGVVGNKVPLYGGGPTLTAGNTGSKGSTTKVAPVPMILRTTIHSRAYVLGALVKPKFTRAIECKVLMNPAKLNKPISLDKACIYL